MNQQIIRQNSVRKIRDRYKPLFCTQDFYEKNQNHFAKLATEIVADENIKPDRFEKFIVSTLILSLLRRPENWFGGFRKDPLDKPAVTTTDNRFLRSVKMKRFTDALQIKWSTNVIDTVSVYEFLSSVKIKAIPEKVFWSLHFLSKNKNLFLISTNTPSPYDLLKIQARGQRVITFEENFLLWNQLIYEHRDVLSFWLHDLVHAAEFFHDDDQKNHQIFFYRWIEVLSADSSLEHFLRNFLNSESNRTRFEYLISDMNSHPLHLIKTFRAILDEDHAENWLSVVKSTAHLLQKSRTWTQNSVQTLESLTLVNSPQFQPFQYDAMLHILSCINEIWVQSNK